MRTTFEVVTWLLPMTSAHLNPTLIPILVDRAVPEQFLHAMFQAGLEHEGKNFMDVVRNPQLLYRWSYSKASVIQGNQEDTEKVWLGNLPLSKPKEALDLLEHGLEHGFRNAAAAIGGQFRQGAAANALFRSSDAPAPSWRQR